MYGFTVCEILSSAAYLGGLINTTVCLSYSLLLGNDLGLIREVEELCVVLRGKITFWQLVEFLIGGQFYLKGSLINRLVEANSGWCLGFLHIKESKGKKIIIWLGRQC